MSAADAAELADRADLIAYFGAYAASSFDRRQLGLGDDQQHGGDVSIQSAAVHCAADAEHDQRFNGERAD